VAPTEGSPYSKISGARPNESGLETHVLSVNPPGSNAVDGAAIVEAVEHADHVLSGPDRVALTAAYEAIGPDLWRAVYGSSGGRRDIADDAVASAFATAAEGLDRIRDIKNWLFRVAFRMATDLMRERRELRDGSVHHIEDASAGLSYETAQLLRSLPPRQRGCVVLVDVFGFTTREAARALGVTDVAVRVSLHAGRTRVRQILEEDDAHD
jgi:RNA polymerase sigma-70 factor (ECF subfamily)